MPRSAKLTAKPSKKSLAMTRQSTAEPKPSARADGHNVRAAMRINQRKYPQSTTTTGQAPGTMVNLYGTTAESDQVPLYPGIYATETAAAEHLAFKQMLRQSNMFAGQQNAPVNWTVDATEMAAFKDLQNANLIREWDSFLERVVDWRKPGMLAWLRNIDSKFIERRMEALNREIHLNKRIQEINMLGPQNLEDFILIFQLLKGELRDQRVDGNGYVPGWLAPQMGRMTAPTGWSNWFNRAQQAGDHNARTHTINYSPDFSSTPGVAGGAPAGLGTRLYSLINGARGAVNYATATAFPTVDGAVRP